MKIVELDYDAILLTKNKEKLYQFTIFCIEILYPSSEYFFLMCKQDIKIAWKV